MAQRRKNGSYNKTPVSGVTWAEAIRRFLAHLAGPAEASSYTYDHYRRDIEHFEDWWKAARRGQKLELGELLGSDLRDWKDFLRADPIDKATGRTRKPAAINAKLAAMRSFLAWAEENRLIAEAPLVPKRVKEARLAYKAVPRTDQNRLLRCVESKRVRRDIALVLVLFDCGLRVSELCALKWRDVELFERKGDLAIWEGKGGKHRSVPISKRCRAALRDLRIGPEGESPAPEDPVFASRKGASQGGHMTPRAVQKLLDKYCRPLGIHVSPHMCRHSCAKDMLDRGNQVPAVQAILGHENPTTTMGYLTSSPEDLRRAVEREGED
jgi:integrase/recombinase XerC